MSIIRTSKAADPYARIDNRALRDKDLSFKARGLLAYLLSMPDNWETNIEHLTTQGRDGRAAVAAGLKELENAGYLVRRRMRGERGRMSGWESIVHEVPPKAENPIIGEPVNRENRESDNRPLRTTQEKNEQEEEQATPVVVACPAPPDDPMLAEDQRLCESLATHIENHSASNRRPVVTARWRKDMRLLRQRGPTGTVAAPTPIAHIEAVIRATFSELNDPNGRGFCWADQIRSPSAVREHWSQLVDAVRAHRHKHTPSRSTTDAADRAYEQRKAAEQQTAGALT